MFLFVAAFVLSFPFQERSTTQIPLGPAGTPRYSHAAMASIRPLEAIRPTQTEVARRICAPPYDVMTEREARARAQREPLSFVWVTRPEVHFPEGTLFSQEAAYQKARDRLIEHLRTGRLIREPRLCLYLYRESSSTHTQTGWVLLASCAEYESGRIRRHELTQPEKEEDRLRHIETLGAQTGMAMLFHRPHSSLRRFIQQIQSRTPFVDFEFEDGVRHTAWVVSDAQEIHTIQKAFQEVETLYIADGHHRTAAAVRLWKERGRPEPLAGFLATVFSAEELQILPYHRALRQIPPQKLHQALEEIDRRFPSVLPPQPQPTDPNLFSLFAEGRWRTYQLPLPSQASPGDPATLAVARLQQFVLAPIFGIQNPRTDPRLVFIGGLHALEELEEGVRSGRLACALTVPPVSIEQLMAVADAGHLMPPKSTWFEPKLLDGLFSYPWDPELK